MPHYSDASKEKLKTCHPKLQDIFNLLIKFYDVTIDCGLRNEERQKEAVLKGTSNAEYPLSSHNRSKKSDGTWDYEMSDAIDTIPYPIKWPDMKSQSNVEYVRRMGRFWFMAGAVLAIAFIQGTKIKWGGHFKSFFDGPHFELDHEK